MHVRVVFSLTNHIFQYIVDYLCPNEDDPIFIDHLDDECQIHVEELCVLLPIEPAHWIHDTFHLLLEALYRVFSQGYILKIFGIVPPLL